MGPPPGAADAGGGCRWAPLPSDPGDHFPFPSGRRERTVRGMTGGTNARGVDILEILDVGRQNRAGGGSDASDTDICWVCLERAWVSSLGLCPACDAELRVVDEAA